MSSRPELDTNLEANTFKKNYYIDQYPWGRPACTGLLLCLFFSAENRHETKLLIIFQRKENSGAAASGLMYEL